MMEKSALAGEGGGCTPTPFQPITYCSVAPAERADTLLLFHLYPYMCSVLGTKLSGDDQGELERPKILYQLPREKRNSASEIFGLCVELEAWGHKEMSSILADSDQ
jgi:hypothetical protein